MAGTFFFFNVTSKTVICQWAVKFSESEYVGVLQQTKAHGTPRSLFLEERGPSRFTLSVVETRELLTNMLPKKHFPGRTPYKVAYNKLK